MARAKPKKSDPFPQYPQEEVLREQVEYLLLSPTDDRYNELIELLLKPFKEKL